jgi:hypothetical protein
MRYNLNQLPATVDEPEEEIIDGELLKVIEPKDFLDRVLDVGIATENGQDSFIGSLFNWLGL